MMSNIETAVKEVKEKLNEKEELMGGAEVWEYLALASQTCILHQRPWQPQ
jgi:hypothetical protein